MNFKNKFAKFEFSTYGNGVGISHRLLRMDDVENNSKCHYDNNVPDIVNLPLGFGYTQE